MEKLFTWIKNYLGHQERTRNCIEIEIELEKFLLIYVTDLIKLIIKTFRLTCSAIFVKRNSLTNKYQLTVAQMATHFVKLAFRKYSVQTSQLFAHNAESILAEANYKSVKQLTWKYSSQLRRKRLIIWTYTVKIKLMSLFKHKYQKSLISGSNWFWYPALTGQHRL